MKISSKVECGLISLVDICVYSGNSVVTVINISARQHISAKYLEQILPQLRQAAMNLPRKRRRVSPALSSVLLLQPW